MTKTTEMEAAFLTVPEAAALLRLSAHTVTRLLKRGTLPGVYAGNRQGWRVRRADVLGFTTNQQQQQQRQQQHEESTA